jgi:Zn-dependent M28 family amino/carboxypeptidase
MTEGKTALQEALRRHVTTLCVEIGPRTTLDPDSLARAASYIRGAFEDAGLDVSEQRYDHRKRSVANLIAAPRGSSPARAYYVVGAHYDTVPGSPGADDNASAVAVLLELARRLAKTGAAAPVRLVAFTLEEPPNFMTGHQGSRVFVREVERSGEQVLGAVVLEMVGYTTPKQVYPLVLKWAGYPDQGNFIGIVGNWASRRFAKTVLKGFRRNPGLPVESLLVPLNGWILPSTRLSDHASFWDRGLPAVMVTDTAFFRNPFYHSPLDVPETLDLPFMAELVTSLELALAELAA